MLNAINNYSARIKYIQESGNGVDSFFFGQGVQEIKTIITNCIHSLSKENMEFGEKSVL